MEQSNTLLDVKKLEVSYGHVDALKGVDVTVNQGEIVVLIGANGAGKTTLLDTILGINTPRSGSIQYNGTDITGRSADINVREGLTIVPEGRGVFTSMTVTDNLLLGAHHNMHESSDKIERVYQWFPILKERSDQMAGTLSGGERQMLAIGRALMSAPRIILVDEPSIGLAPIIVNNIIEILVNLNKEGYTILLSEQNAYKALKIAHRGYVLETGQVVLSGTAEELLEDPAVKDAYLGA
ncbi:MAG: ABC transporter ATP-binding protein [Spirochaetales bacterium]|nr:ABC transporter ATP-binding protein [Spirochaetales bacterium]MCF7938448.1 ABC transporter ATP-binding protein [Spirochaetales bacterium]